MKSAVRCTVSDETKLEICSCFEKVVEVARNPQMALKNVKKCSEVK
jgi:hypothetical protein